MILLLYNLCRGYRFQYYILYLHIVFEYPDYHLKYRKYLQYVPEIQDIPVVPEIPGIPVVPEIPEISVVHEITEVPVVPEIPEVPVVPEIPEIPVVLEKREGFLVPGAPGAEWVDAVLTPGPEGVSSVDHSFPGSGKIPQPEQRRHKKLEIKSLKYIHV
jgi:hypothetical protein